MAGHWLYVISINGTIDTAGEKIPGNFKNDADLVGNERLSLDRRWHAEQNCGNVEITDKVFIYSGETE